MTVNHWLCCLARIKQGAATFGHHTAQGPDFNHAGYVQGLILYSYFTGEYNHTAYGHWSAVYEREGKPCLAHRSLRIAIKEAPPGVVALPAR